MAETPHAVIAGGGVGTRAAEHLADRGRDRLGGAPGGVGRGRRNGGHVGVQHSTRLVGGRRYLVAADRDVVGEVIRLCRGGADAS